MFGQQQGGFPAAAGQLPAGAGRGSVFGGSAPGGSSGPPSAASVFGGHAPSRVGTSEFATPSVFGGSTLHGVAAAAGPASSAVVTPAAVFGSSQPAASRSVFGANPVAATTIPGASAASVFGQQQQQLVAARSFFGSLPATPSTTQRPAGAGGVGLSTVASVTAAGSSSSSSGPPASPSSVFGAHARSTSKQPFADPPGPATPSVFGSQPAHSMALAGGGGQQQQNMPLISLTSGQAGGSAMPLSSTPASVPFGRANAGTSGHAQSMSARTVSPATGAASAYPAQPPTVPVSMSAAAAAAPAAAAGLLFGKAVAPVAGVAAGSAAPAAAAGGSPSAALQLSGLLRPLYSELADLSLDELAQFKASHFTVDNIPLKPPPRQLVH